MGFERTVDRMMGRGSGRSDHARLLAIFEAEELEAVWGVHVAT
jgi:hypothetical protein